MLDKIKNFVQSVSPTTWLLVGVGVLAFVVLSWVSSHSKAPEATPTVIVVPVEK